MAKVILEFNDEEEQDQLGGFITVKLTSNPPYPPEYNEGKKVDVRKLTVAQWVGHEMLKKYAEFEIQNSMLAKGKKGDIEQ